MERSREFHGVKFSIDTIRSSMNDFRQVVSELGEQVIDHTLRVSLPDGQWTFDNESEFLSALHQGGSYSLYMNSQSVRFRVNQFRRFALVEVRSGSRQHIQRIFSAFDMNQGADAVPSDSPVVFIGHGRSGEWRDLRDHLRDQHDYRIECYESGSRAGHSIRDILESMIEKSSFALLVMTGEDMQASGDFRARQNVIHEAGLFQGRLGFARAIILLEEGVEQFSNVQGVQYIPFSKGRIREAYGDVLAVLRREFGGN